MLSVYVKVSCSNIVARILDMILCLSIEPSTCSWAHVKEEGERGVGGVYVCHKPNIYIKNPQPDSLSFWDLMVFNIKCI